MSPGTARGGDSAEAFTPLLSVLHRLAGIDARVGGGWGVDLLAGRVTRDHHDIDCFVGVEALGDAVGRVVDAGFEVVVDEGRCRVVLTSPAGERVDLGGIAYRRDGHGVQADTTGDIEVFPAWGWTERMVDETRIVCLSAEAQRLKHRGYPPRPLDMADLAAIAHINEPACFDPAVRPVEAGEQDLVAGIEIASDRLLEPFGVWPLPAADPAAKAAERARTATTLVAGRPPVGFARLEIVDGHAHLGQLSVLPEYGRLGVGTSLAHAACQWSRRQGFRFITLTTFADIPFNAPFYRRLGFYQLTDDQIGPELTQVVTDEADLERFGMRVTMGRTLTDHEHDHAPLGTEE
ncbi:MAG: GNAT family N-acetyltransferase [Actinomycetota bacterium]|nr:GNAT family N-acetyltransferase [Actinomycetota bacterium]